jgi:hypothetical protein
LGFSPEDCYQGPYADEMPDIISGDAPGLRQQRQVEQLQLRSLPTGRTLTIRGHHIEGFSSAGPEITASPEPLQGVVIDDIARLCCT